MIKASLVLLMLISLAGCQLTKVEGEIDDVEVKVSTKDSDKRHDGDYKFCPPGQAKKGNC